MIRDEFVAGHHVRRSDFAVEGLIERLEEGWIGVAFPYEQAQRLCFLLAGAESCREQNYGEKQGTSRHLWMILASLLCLRLLHYTLAADSRQEFAHRA